MTSPPDLEAVLSDLEKALTTEGVASRRAHPPRRLVLAVPLVIALAAALFVGLGVGNEQPAAAARQLQAAAKLVAGEPAPVIGPGQYWYVKGQGAFVNSVMGGGGEFSALQTSTHEIWIASDASGRIVRSDGAPAFFSAAERARWEAAGKPGFTGSGIDEQQAAGELSWGWEGLGVHAASEIPTDSSALARLIEAHADQNKNPRASEELSLIFDVLRFAPLSGAQTAAFYAVLAGLPGIEVIGSVKDGVGRTGTAFAVERNSSVREEIILDPDTGRLLGSRSILTTADGGLGGAPAGTVIGSETIVSRGVVASTNSRP